MDLRDHVFHWQCQRQLSIRSTCAMFTRAKLLAPTPLMPKGKQANQVSCIVQSSSRSN